MHGSVWHESACRTTIPLSDLKRASEGGERKVRAWIEHMTRARMRALDYWFGHIQG